MTTPAVTFSTLRATNNCSDIIAVFKWRLFVPSPDLVVNQTTAFIFQTVRLAPGQSFGPLLVPAGGPDTGGFVLPFELVTDVGGFSYRFVTTDLTLTYTQTRDAVGRNICTPVVRGGQTQGIVQPSSKTPVRSSDYFEREAIDDYEDAEVELGLSIQLEKRALVLDQAGNEAGSRALERQARVLRNQSQASIREGEVDEARATRTEKKEEGKGPGFTIQNQADFQLTVQVTQSGVTRPIIVPGQKQIRVTLFSEGLVQVRLGRAGVSFQPNRRATVTLTNCSGTWAPELSSSA